MKHPRGNLRQLDGIQSARLRKGKLLRRAAYSSCDEAQRPSHSSRCDYQYDRGYEHQTQQTEQEHMLAHVGSLSTKAKTCTPTSLRANRKRCVISCTLRIIIILMEIIKDLSQTVRRHQPRRLPLAI